MISSTASLRPFTPTREDPDDLTTRTVGREALIKALVGRLLAAATTPDRTHSLLIGPRGAGKTHVVEVVLHEVRSTPEAEKLLIVRLPEDMVGVTNIHDLFVELVAASAPDQLDAARALRRERDIGALEKLISTIAAGRTLVIVIENLHRAFSAIGTEGQRSLRAWLETSRHAVLLATAPLLTDSVSNRDAPWFGSFSPDYLGDLSVDDGQRLLVELHRGDARLAEYLASDEAHRRLQALSYLAGGSPRLWTIAAMCITIDSLDELVPAVEDLLEKLVPYYQERLWELSALEQKLIKTIAEEGSIVVRELADIVGEDQRTVGTTLRRLEQVGWVHAEKRPGTDQRLTFYELREPLVRHHFDYRDTDRQSLQLIVDVLKVWFDPSDRVRMLSRSSMTENAMRHLAGSLQGEPLRGDFGYAARNTADLLATARVWASMTTTADDGLGNANLGQLLISIIEGATSDPTQTAAFDVKDRIGQALSDALDTEASDPMLSIIEACWNSPGRSVDTLSKLQHIDVDSATPELRYLVRSEVAYYTGQTGDPETALHLYTQLLPDQTTHLGPHHPDTLATRGHIAYYTGETGDPETALHLYTQLLPDQSTHLGPHHRDTLITRAQIAYYTGQTGDPETALHLYTQLLPDRTTHLGPHHRDTLTTRDQIAYYTGETGDPETALHLYTQLLPDQTTHLGPHHPNTLTTRAQIAYYTGVTGGPETALDLYAQLLPEADRALESDHELVRAIRTQRSVLALKTGDLDSVPAELHRLTEK